MGQLCWFEGSKSAKFDGCAVYLTFQHLKYFNSVYLLMIICNGSTAQKPTVSKQNSGMLWDLYKRSCTPVRTHAYVQAYVSQGVQSANPSNIMPNGIWITKLAIKAPSGTAELPGPYQNGWVSGIAFEANFGNWFGLLNEFCGMQKNVPVESLADAGTVSSNAPKVQWFPEAQVFDLSRTNNEVFMGNDRTSQTISGVATEQQSCFDIRGGVSGCTCEHTCVILE